jgi:ABC-type glycerol-3-phosphate transport system substrate-binding protein
MEITKRFIDAGAVPEGWETWNYPAAWKMGKVAMAINQHSMGTWGGLIWGYDRLAMMPTPVGDPVIQESGTMFWATSIPLYKAAPYPQETTDFLLWLVDPENELWHRGVFEAGKMSGFRSAYDKYINPDDVTQNWALGVLPQLEAATPPPPTKWYWTQHGKIVPRLIEFLKGAKPAQQAMQEAWDAFQDEVAGAA